MKQTPPFASVWFDCDSTLSRLEGIDELARRRADLHERIAALTNAAMDGTVALQDIYGERLRLIAPTHAEVQALGTDYVATMVPGARSVVAALRAAGAMVGIVSGGLRPAVLVLARALGVDDAHVHAVDLDFDGGGSYRGFDHDSPLARAGGKRELMAALPARLRPSAFVGDGSTDLETRGAVDLFVGFGGVVRRPSVEAGADAFVADEDLRAVLAVLQAHGERGREPG
ncbi:MAG: HAD-IB family phosphatase [Planctomycetota bacterium]